MQTAQIEEEGQPSYEAKIEDFDPANKKGAFEAAQFTESHGKMNLPVGQFKLTLDGETYLCLMLIATHFSISDAAELTKAVAAAAKR